MMTSPFDHKNKVAAALDRYALRIVLLFVCVLYFFFLFKSSLPSLLCGAALFVLLSLLLMLLERRTLSRRNRVLRERVSGAMALDSLLLKPNADACRQVCSLLCEAFGARALSASQMYYDGETWLIRCAQVMQGANAGAGDVLAAHRSRMENGADKCALASTAGFSPEAVRTAEWMDPPVRLISGRQLSLLHGRLHPASDEEIAAHFARKKKPFSWQRIRALALSPAKLRRHLLCALLLLSLYLFTQNPSALLGSLLSFSLAVLSDRESKKRFSL